MALALLLVALGFVGAFVSGLVGLGGAIVTVPLLLYVPPLVGFGALDMRTVAGITMVQVVAASAVGFVAHGRQRALNARLALIAGGGMAAGTFAGAVGSRHLASGALLGVFAVLVTGSALLLLLPAQTVDPEMLAGEVRFSARAAAVVATGAGVIAGMVGAGGAFLLIPLLLVVVRVPMRVAIASSLAIAAIGSVSGFIGKLVTGQIVFALALPVVAGALPAAPLGAWVSRRVSVGTLRAMLFAVLGVTAVRVWYDLLVR